MVISNKAQYNVLAVYPGCIVLEDIGPWDRYKTVTNAADSVVQEVIQVYGSGKRIFYNDSEGELAELLIKDGAFAGFATANAKDLK